MATSSEAVRFSLREIFATMTLVGLTLALMANGWYIALLIGLWILAFALLAWYRRVDLALVVFAVPVVAVLLLPSVGSRETPRRTGCIANVRQINLAILNYESASRKFPPPYTVDAQGNRLHSWRVLILPYLDETELFDQIDLSKPWNDPVNLKFADRMPDVFRCPQFKPKTRAQRNTTAYVAVVGDRTIWPPAGRRTSRDITDGGSKTLSIVESEAYRTNWMAPFDPTIDQIASADGTGQSLLGNSPHSGGVSVCGFADVHTKALPGNLSLDLLRGMLIINDGLGEEPQPARR